IGRLISTSSCTMHSRPGTVFVDTSAWKAFYDENDDWHKEARGFMNSIGTTQPPIRLFVTSDYVMDETLTLVRFAHSHSKAVEFANTISSSRATKLFFVGEDLFNQALSMFIGHQDQQRTFTDCSAFVLH